MNDGKSADSARKFQFWMEEHVGFLRDGAPNIERIQLAPLLPADDDFFRHLLRGELDANGLVADPTPPFALYPTNLNHVGPWGTTSYRCRSDLAGHGAAPFSSPIADLTVRLLETLASLRDTEQGVHSRRERTLP